MTRGQRGGRRGGCQGDRAAARIRHQAADGFRLLVDRQCGQKATHTTPCLQRGSLVEGGERDQHEASDVERDGGGVKPVPSLFWPPPSVRAAICSSHPNTRRLTGMFPASVIASTLGDVLLAAMIDGRIVAFAIGRPAPARA